MDESGLITALHSGEASISVSGADGLSGTLDVEIIKWADKYDPISIAHRGASGYRQDNTIAAFNYAMQLGADMIELDVMKTSDGEIICFHDLSVESGGDEVSVSRLTLRQMRSIFPKLCTLEEALACIAQGNILLQVELKVSNIEEEVVQLVKAAGMQDRTCYGSFILNSLKNVRQFDPAAKLVYITNQNSTVKSVLADPGKFAVDVMSIRKDLLSEDRITRFHLAGMQVYGWTIDEKTAIGRYAAMGLDGVISNYPDRI